MESNSVVNNKSNCDPGEKVEEKVAENVITIETESATSTTSIEPILDTNEELKVDTAVTKSNNQSKTNAQENKPNIVEPKMDARNKKLERTKRKNEKNFDLFLKSLQNMSLQDQIEVLIKKNTSLMDEIATTTNANKIFKAKVAILEKEKEQLKLEQNKNFTARTRLENICRELQKQNKQIKDETAAKIREEEEKRKEITTTFQATLSDVSKMMEQNSSENIKLRDDNIKISDRFKKLCEEFKTREEDIQRISKQLGLEKKLSEANLQRSQLELEAEREEKKIWLEEKEKLLRKLHDVTKDKLLLEINIKSLEEHLTKYSNKYQKFETTIAKSNEIFENYKVELAQMSKQVTKLEKDCLVWKERWVQTSQSVNRLIGVNQTLEQDLKNADKKLEQLGNLSRSLQNERTRYLMQLRENNIQPVQIVEPPAPTPPPVEVNKPITPPPAPIATQTKGRALTAKEKELQALREEIIKLQADINKAVEKEIEDKLKSKQEEENMSKNKRRVKGKKNKKNRTDDNVSLENDNKTNTNINNRSVNEQIPGPCQESQDTCTEGASATVSESIPTELVTNNEPNSTIQNSDNLNTNNSETCVVASTNELNVQPNPEESVENISKTNGTAQECVLQNNTVQSESTNNSSNNSVETTNSNDNNKLLNDEKSCQNESLKSAEASTNDKKVLNSTEEVIKNEQIKTEPTSEEKK